MKNSSGQLEYRAITYYTVSGTIQYTGASDSVHLALVDGNGDVVNGAEGDYNTSGGAVPYTFNNIPDGTYIFKTIKPRR